MSFPIGADVLVRSLGNRPGVVIAVDRRNRHQVRMGAALAWCEEGDLAAVVVSKSAARRKRKTEQAGARESPSARTSAEPPNQRASVPRIDLHGLTVEEAMARTLAAIDRALQDEADAIEIVHGKGSGRIRAALHRLLASISVVKSYALDARNPGVTRARF